MRCYALRYTLLRRSGGNNNNATKKSAAEEDREELERERQLRERFAEKIQKSVSQGDRVGADCANGSCAAGGSASRKPVEAFFRIFFFIFAAMTLVAMSNLSNRDSPIYMMQGLPWWELPITSAAYFLLLRATHPRSEENRIKGEFEAASRSNPRLTFDQFMVQQYPNMFDGYRTTQAEAVAAVAACLAAAKDLKFAQTMVRSVRWSRDPRANTDLIIDALRKDFSHVF